MMTSIKQVWKRLISISHSQNNTLKKTRRGRPKSFKSNCYLQFCPQEKDKLLSQINTQKTELENEVSHLEKVVAEKEELIQNQKSAIDHLKGESFKDKQKAQEIELRQEVVNSYLEATKKSYEEMRSKLEIATESLGELKKQDWSKQILDLKRENEFLREEMTQKQKEITGFKNNIAMAIQTSASSNAQSHLTNLLENQSKDNVRLNRLIQEYERKEKQCTRKWTALLQENLSIQEKHSG